MEISTSQRKIEVVFTKVPFLLKAGIPLFLPIAAFLSSKILLLSKRRTTSSSSSTAAISPSSVLPSAAEGGKEHHKQKEEESSPSPLPNSTNDTTKSSCTQVDSIIDDDEEEAVIEDLYRREIELELRFILYQGHKERESKLLEINHKLCLEKAQLEFLVREVGLMEDEGKRMGEMVMGYLKLMKEINGLRWVNGLTHSKGKKLSSRLKNKSNIVREQREVMKARDEEFKRYRVELSGKDGVIQELRDEIGLLRFTVDQLEMDKIELSNKIEESISSNPNEIGEEFVSKEDNDYVVKELLRVESELTALRWDNACLRHDIIRLKQEKDDHKYGDDFNHSADSGMEHHHKRINNSENRSSGSSEVIRISDWQAQSSGSEINTPQRDESRRKRLMKKLKGWVEGGKSSDHHKKENPRDECLGVNSVADSDEATEHYLPQRNSFSSV